MNTYTLKAKAVASKFLLKEISDFIGEIIEEFSILYQHDVHRDSILEVIEEYLAEYAQDGKITQYNVICDNRNNNMVLADAGITNLEIRYKQDNCYALTVLEYTIISDRDA